MSKKKRAKMQENTQPVILHPLNKPAFTLAEVLITLGIIGVVAAMTIPTLISNTNGAQFKTGFKKACFSIFFSKQRVLGLLNWA